MIGDSFDEEHIDPHGECAAEIKRLRASNAELCAALADMFALMHEGVLVRVTVDDARPDWAIRQLPFIRRLQSARSALLKAGGAG